MRKTQAAPANDENAHVASNPYQNLLRFTEQLIFVLILLLLITPAHAEVGTPRFAETPEAYRNCKSILASSPANNLSRYALAGYRNHLHRLGQGNSLEKSLKGVRCTDQQLILYGEGQGLLYASTLERAAIVKAAWGEYNRFLYFCIPASESSQSDHGSDCIGTITIWLIEDEVSNVTSLGGQIELTHSSPLLSMPETTSIYSECGRILSSNLGASLSAHISRGAGPVLDTGSLDEAIRSLRCSDDQLTSYMEYHGLNHIETQEQDMLTQTAYGSFDRVMHFCNQTQERTDEDPKTTCSGVVSIRLSDDTIQYITSHGFL